MKNHLPSNTIRTTGLLLLCAPFVMIAHSQVPTVTSFSPLRGVAGTTVTITGTNFNTTPANNIVYFGAAKATVTAATATELTVTSPYGATYDMISVLNTATGKAVKSSRFFTPVSYGSGTINTTNFPVSGISGISATITSASRVDFADFDQDGFVDIVVNNGTNESISNALYVFRNTSTASGSINFALAATLTIANTSSAFDRTDHVGVGDIDMDGKPDIVGVKTTNSIVNGVGYTFSVYKNTSTSGAISFNSELEFPSGGSNGLFSPKIVDLNGDGLNDMIGGSNGTFRYRLNTSSGGTISFAAPVSLSSGSGFYYGIDAGDLNNDGKIEAAGGNGSAFVYLQNQNPTTPILTATSAAISSPTFNSGTLADLNQDGLLDYIATDYGGSSNIYYVFRNTSAGSVSFSTSPAQSFSRSTGTPYQTDAGDIDGDGVADLIISYYNSGINLIKNSTDANASTFSFGTPFSLTTSGAVSAALADFNNDGKNDIAIASTSGNKLYAVTNSLTGITLPLSWIDFSARVQDDHSVALSWSTENEMNVKEFETEFSTDGITYQRGATIAAQNQMKNEYMSVHVPQQTGKLYYRVRQTDIDGRFTYSPVRTVIIHSSLSVITYPNPVLNELKIQFTGIIPQARLDIRSINGQSVYQQKLTGSLPAQTISTDSWKPGLYILKISDANGSMLYQEKLIKK